MRSPNLAVARLQILTISWMLIECGVSLSAAIRAHSVSLLAFGSDSFVELLSAVIVILQFSPMARLNEERAARISGTLLFVLAGIVALTALLALALQVRPNVSFPGMAVTLGALLLMPSLALMKRRKAREIHNRALAADAIQSATCAYLAAVTLLSLIMNALFHWAWIDSLAALTALPLLIAEGRRARRGESCGCC